MAGPTERASCMVASPRECNCATDSVYATTGATEATPISRKAASLRELRMQLSVQPARNPSSDQGMSRAPQLHASVEVPAHVSLLIAQVAVVRGWSEADKAETVKDWRACPEGIETGLRHLLVFYGEQTVSVNQQRACND